MSRTSGGEVSNARPVYKSSLKKLEYMREYTRKNREEILSKKREYYRKNKEKLAEYHKERWEDPDIQKRIKSYKKQWHQENKEKIVTKATKWNKENSDRRKKITATYRSKNAEKARIKAKATRVRNRKLAIEYYSNGENKCACCNESIYHFLTIDHINGGGNEHRRSINLKGGHHFYAWLKQQNYPLGYQVLCFNCNQARGYYGYCHAMPENTIEPL